MLVNIIDGSNNTHFIFYYFWQNDTDFSAVANVSTSLIFNGPCFVQAKPGIFSGDTADLKIGASLGVMRWFGWGTDPVTGDSRDQTLDPDFQSTEVQSVTSLHAHGGHIFGSAGSDSETLVFQGVPLRHDLLVVPAGASVVFQVSMDLNYGFHGGGDIQDIISVDFETNGRGVFSPHVQLEVLTPLPNLVVSAPSPQSSSLAGG